MSSASPTRLSIANTSADVWIKIFEALMDDGPRDLPCGFHLTPLLRVCKKWKELVTPLVFRYIFIREKSSLETLAIRLLLTQPTSDQPGMWTQSLVLRLRDSETHASHICSLLLRMSNIHTYSVHGPFTLATELDLLRHCAPGLKRFAATITYDDESSFALTPQATLRLLSNFSNLGDISMDFRTPLQASGGVRLSPESVTKFPHSLTRLDLGVNRSGDFSALRWLRTPGLRHLTLRTVPSPSPDDLDEELQSIRRFLAAQSHLHHLRLSLPSSWLEDLLRGHWINANHVELLDMHEQGVPDMVDNPGSLTVEILSLHIDLSPSQTFWEFLQVLASASPSGMTALKIILADPIRFTWGCGSSSEEHATFVGSILARALELQKIGIAVYDEDGRRFELCF